MGDTSAARGRIRQQVAALGPRGVTSRVPDAIRATIVDYARARQAAGAGWPTIAREVGFSVGAITSWARAQTAPSRLRPVAVRAAAVVALPAAGLVVALPNGVRIEGLQVADIPALLAQLAGLAARGRCGCGRIRRRPICAKASTVCRRSSRRSSSAIRFRATAISS